MIGDCYKAGERKCYYYGNYCKTHKLKRNHIDVEVRAAEDKKILRNHHENPMKVSKVLSLLASRVSTWLITTEPRVVPGPLLSTPAIPPDSDSCITSEEGHLTPF